MLLTKSKYISGLQCPKLLWYLFNSPESIPSPSEEAEYRFSVGYSVENYAREWFPSGVAVPTDDFSLNIKLTSDLLKGRKVLFEAGILVGGLYARADVLVPSGEDMWDIVEIKSSTSVKDVNISDVAFQKYVYTKYGLKINKCFVMVVDNTYVRKGDVDASGLMKKEDVTSLVDTSEISKRISDMFVVISSPKFDFPIGPYCDDPYTCVLKSLCWAYLPSDNVFELYYGGKKSWSLFASDILSIADIPSDFKLSSKQQIQKEVVISGKTHVDKEAVDKFISSLEYPIYYLDFETINPAIPLFDGVRPYQQIPFQFSLHVQAEDGSVEHHEFLHMEASDPRPAFLEALKKVLGDSGSIVVFNQSFEIGRLRECSEAFPEYKEGYDNLLPRFVDLITPFKEFWWHSPKQKGSNSIKKVLPAVTGRGYDDLEIGDGGTASRAYLEMVYGDISDEEKEKIRVNLLKYCSLDTEGMVWVVKGLRTY